MKYGLDNPDLEGNQVGVFTYPDDGSEDDWLEDETKSMTLWEAYRFMQDKQRDGDPITDRVMETLEDIFKQPKAELVAYAIDKDDAEKALAWKGIGLAEGDSLASGIERLYATMQNLRGLPRFS